MPALDDDNYPTEEALERIRKWDVIPDGERERCLDWIGANCWHFTEWGWRKDEHGVYQISTGGWSGNEETLGAMRENFLLWMMTFYNHRVGGHYTLRLNPDTEIEMTMRVVGEGDE